MKSVLAGGVVALALSVAMANVGLGGRGAAEYTRIDGAGEPLRTAFNADRGKVRVLMLVAPT